MPIGTTNDTFEETSPFSNRNLALCEIWLRLQFGRLAARIGHNNLGPACRFPRVDADNAP